MRADHPVRLREAMIRRPIVEEMDQYPELTRGALLRRLIEGTGATRTLFATKDGEITDTLEVADFSERRHATAVALQLRNEFPAKQLDIASTMRVESLHDHTISLEHVPMEQLIELTQDQYKALPAEASPGGDAEAVGETPPTNGNGAHA